MPSVQKDSLLERTNRVKEGSLYCDGASSGNPGRSGIGVVLKSEGNTYEMSESIGIATNNVAEYTALLRGLEKAKALRIEKLRIFLDSELLVRQILGEYKVKSEHLKGLYHNVMTHLKGFKAYTIKHIPREQNNLADKLAKKAASL